MTVDDSGIVARHMTALRRREILCYVFLLARFAFLLA